MSVRTNASRTVTSRSPASAAAGFVRNGSASNQYPRQPCSASARVQFSFPSAAPISTNVRLRTSMRSSSAAISPSSPCWENCEVSAACNDVMGSARGVHQRTKFGDGALGFGLLQARPVAETRT